MTDGAALLDTMLGQRFGRLHVAGYIGRKHHSSMWRCLCVCGNEIVVQRSALVSGSTKSCGCYRRERMARLTYKHGECGSRKRIRRSAEYKAWDSMRQRCMNPKAKNWGLYGGRGITICAKWSDFESFLSDMGPRPAKDYSLDRMDNSGNYEPDNCRWATIIEQARNRRNNRATHLSKTLVESAEIVGIRYKTVKGRLSHGWSIERALSEPVNHGKRAAALNSIREAV